MKLLRNLLLSTSILMASLSVEASSSSTSSDLQEEMPRAYALSLQSDSSCHLHPFINRAIIQKIRAREGGDLVFQPQDFTSRFVSYAQSFEPQRIWHMAMTDLVTANGPFKQHLDLIANQGIISSKIFKPNGKRFAEDVSFLKPFEKVLRFALTPYNLLDLESVGEQGASLMLPLASVAGKMYLFNPNTSRFDVLKEGEGGSPLYLPVKESFEPKLFALSDAQRDYLCKNNSRRLRFYEEPRYGSAAVYYAAYLPEAGDHQQHYMTGLFQLVMFAHGIDDANQKFTPAHSYFPAFQEFQAAMQKNPKNPWSSLNPENFLEYRIARLFDTNQALKQQVLSVIDRFMPGWGYYQELSNLVDDKGQKLRRDLLPGENQMLAYNFSLQTRFLWGSALNQRALNAMTDIREIATESIGQKTVSRLEFLQKNVSFMPLSVSKFRSEGMKGGSKSFVAVWQNVTRALAAEQSTPLMDFASFAGHGSVITFDPKMLNTYTYEAPDLAKALGFIVLDSDWADDLNPPFMKKGDASCKLENQLNNN